LRDVVWENIARSPSSDILNQPRRENDKKTKSNKKAKENEFEIRVSSDEYILFHAGNSEKRLSFNDLTVEREEREWKDGQIH